MPTASKTIDVCVPTQYVDIIIHLLNELDAATTKFPDTTHLTNALTEEVGELAQAQLHQQFEPSKGKTHEHVYMEALQSACVAIRVATEGDSTFPLYEPATGQAQYAQPILWDAETGGSWMKANKHIREVHNFIRAKHLCNSLPQLDCYRKGEEAAIEIEQLGIALDTVYEVANDTFKEGQFFQGFLTKLVNICGMG